jgi:hypothetical protein
MLNVVMLSVVMLGVVMLSVVMLSVVAPENLLFMKSPRGKLEKKNSAKMAFAKTTCEILAIVIFVRVERYPNSDHDILVDVFLLNAPPTLGIILRLS